MRILILEDDSERIEWFRSVFKDEELLTITDNPVTAQRWLESREYDYIFLDHDLAPEHYEQDTVCDKTTGLCIAKHLGESPWISSEAKIFIHSMNPAGARRMQDALKGGKRDCDWIPFNFLKGRIVVS